MQFANHIKVIVYISDTNQAYYASFLKKFSTGNKFYFTSGPR